LRGYEARRWKSYWALRLNPNREVTIVAKKIRVKLIKSPIGSPESHRRTVQALGLNKIGTEVVHDDKPQIRGMVQKIEYMLEVTKE